MRHDAKYSQSHSSAVKQRPDGSIHYTGGHGYDRDHHMGLGKHYHRDGIVVGSPGGPGYPVYSSDRRNSYSSSGGVSRIDGSSSSSGSGSVGGHVSALSGSNSHESEKQWEWLEDTLEKFSNKKENVSTSKLLFFLYLSKTDPSSEFKQFPKNQAKDPYKLLISATDLYLSVLIK